MSESSAGPTRKKLQDLDLSGAHLHSPNFESTRVTDGWFLNADISGYIGGLRVNDVEVEPLVSAVLDRRFPDRVKLRAIDPEGLADAWSMIERTWQSTVERVRRLPEEMWYERVDGEWSFVETLRHLVRATDSWLLRMVKGTPHPYHPWGLSFGADLAAVVDPATRPTLDDVLDVRRGRMEEVRAIIENLAAEDLDRSCVPPDTTGHPSEAHTVLHCLHVILDEEWEHNRYASRDLSVLESRLSS